MFFSSHTLCSPIRHHIGWDSGLENLINLGIKCCIAVIIIHVCTHIFSLKLYLYCRFYQGILAAPFCPFGIHVHILVLLMYIHTLTTNTGVLPYTNRIKPDLTNI